MEPFLKKCTINKVYRLTVAVQQIFKKAHEGNFRTNWQVVGGMNIALQKILSKKYDPSSRIDLRYRDNDITLITNSEGLPVSMFIGKRKSDGSISGERYARNKALKNGIETIHWDRKGKI